MKNNPCIRVFADQSQIAQCRRRISKAARSFALLANILSLAGNDARLKILYLLEDERELCPCDLTDILGMSAPAVSQHLRKLKDGNVIEAQKVGQTIFYSLRQEHLKLLKKVFKTIYLLNQNAIDYENAR